MNWRKQKKQNDHLVSSSMRDWVVGQVHWRSYMGHPTFDIFGKLERAANNVKCWDVPCTMSHVLVEQPNDQLTHDATWRAEPNLISNLEFPRFGSPRPARNTTRPSTHDLENENDFHLHLDSSDRAVLPFVLRSEGK